MLLPDLIAVAQGQKPADLVIHNVRLVNVLAGEIHPAAIAIYQGVVAALCPLPAKQELDGGGAYAAPGFIDGHVHIESSLLTPSQFARAVLPHGTTTVIADPHEIANVWGLKGIDYMLTSSADLPLDIYFMLPSCVPATHLEKSGAELDAASLQPYLQQPRVLGLAEMMNYPGVLSADSAVLEKIELAYERIIDGHAPLLSGKSLAAYCAAGISSDHESSNLTEAREKLRNGLFLMIREGSAARNLLDLLPLVTPTNACRTGFVTDDRHPDMLMDEGHIDSMIKKSVHWGLDPVIAIQMATINTARHFGLKRHGAIAPGYQADIVLFSDFSDMHIQKVFKQGRLVAEDYHLVSALPPDSTPSVSSLNLAPLNRADFKIKAEGDRVHVIGIVPGQIVTQKIVCAAPIVDGWLVSDPAQDLLKLVVIERHRATGRMGKALVKGVGLQQGALASTVAHDSHNLIAVATNDDDLYLAVQVLRDLGGGQVVVSQGRVLAQLPLPVAGLLSTQPLEIVRRDSDQLKQAARRLGCKLDDPFMTLSFLALPVIPELKLTDLGLIDVQQFKPISLWAD